MLFSLPKCLEVLLLLFVVASRSWEEWAEARRGYKQGWEGGHFISVASTSILIDWWCHPHYLKSLNILFVEAFPLAVNIALALVLELIKEFWRTGTFSRFDPTLLEESSLFFYLRRVSRYGPRLQKSLKEDISSASLWSLLNPHFFHGAVPDFSLHSFSSSVFQNQFIPCLIG